MSRKPDTQVHRLAGALKIEEWVLHTVSLSQLIQRGMEMLARVRALAVAVVSETVVVW